MIQGTLANLIKEKVNYTRIAVCIFIVGITGIGLQCFEPYAMFCFLFPVLLIMLLSIVLILRFCLRELQKFQENCKNEDVKKCCACLFPSKNNSLLLVIYLVMVAVYFVCVYRLQFVEINLMGIYIFLFGGGTFFLALISYEVCVRLTISLKETERNKSNIMYDELYPKDTLWLQYFFHFHKVLKNAALVISILFVLENSMLFVANYEKIFSHNLLDASKKSNLIKFLPIEWWAIWVYIFITIVLALPLMTWIRNRDLNSIVSHIQADFNEKMRIPHRLDDLRSNPQKYYSILNIMQSVQNSLKEAYLPHRIDRIASLSASLLTCFAHLISFYMMVVPSFLK